MNEQRKVCPIVLQNPKYVSENTDLDECIPFYCDNMYLKIDKQICDIVPGECHLYREISQKEFAAEFDKCIESFKEQINV